MSIMKVVAMTIGEIEYTRFFTDQLLFSPMLSRMVFLLFCIMMPIVLMNLTVSYFIFYLILWIPAVFRSSSGFMSTDFEGNRWKWYNCFDSTYVKLNCYINFIHFSWRKWTWKFLFLQIGLAVGDIDSIQKNAEYKRLSLEVRTKVCR